MSDYSSNFPTQSPTFAFDAKAGKLDSRISYSRSSTGTAFSAEKHLSSENLLPYSNDLSQSVWTKSEVTIPSNNNVSPDGGAAASSVLETGTTGGHSFYDDFACVSGTSYTFTLYAKPNGRSVLRVAIKATATIAAVDYDLTAVSSTVSSGAADSHSVTAIGSSGWYKLQLTVTGTSTGTGRARVYLHDGSSTSYAGDATKGAYIYGCQVSSTGETVLNETSGSIHREFAPLLKTSQSDQPRFEYSATDGQSNAGTALGLLIEAQSTSLVTYSEDSTQWSKAYSAFQINAGVSPDGTVTATLWTPDATANKHYMSNGMFSATSGTTYTGSVFLKGVNRTRAQLTFGAGGFAGGYVNFSLTGDGSVLTEQAGATGTISSCGNGWYRVTITDTADATTSTTGVTVGLISSDTEARLQTSTLNGYDSLLVTGFQIETGSHASSYIKSNSGSSTSRAADSCSVVDASIFNGGEHSVYWEGSFNGSVSDPRMFSMSDGTTANRFVVDFDDGNVPRIRNWADGTAYMNQYATGQTLPAGSSRIVGTLKTNESRLAINGTQYAVDTTGIAVGTMDRIGIGVGYNGSISIADGHIKRLTYYNVALSQTEAESLTSNP